MIGAITVTNPLVSKLEANGLSEAKAKLVQSEMDAAVKDATSAGADGSKPDGASVRAALDKRVSADVASGKLSKEDAAEVKTTLDQIDAQSGSNATSGSAPSGSVQHGGGGGGGSTSKTELSRTVTISDPIKTTVITYTDGTTKTSTSVATTSDDQRYAKPNAAQASQQDATQSYLSTIEPGSLVDIMV